MQFVCTLPKAPGLTAVSEAERYDFKNYGCSKMYGNVQNEQFPRRHFYVPFGEFVHLHMQTSVYKGYKQDKIEMRGDRAEMSDFPLYLNTVAGGLDCRDQTIGGFSFVVKIYAVPVIEIIG